MKPHLFAIAALLPMMAGTGLAAASEGKSFVAQLCNGGTITIPLDDSDGDGDGGDRSCQQGCHGAPCRKKFDPTQRRDGQPLR